MDKTQNETEHLDYDLPAHDFFELDHAREELVRQLGDKPLTPAQAAWVFRVLAAASRHELEVIASLFAWVRADGPL